MFVRRCGRVSERSSSMWRGPAVPQFAWILSLWMPDGIWVWLVQEDVCGYVWQSRFLDKPVRASAPLALSQLQHRLIGPPLLLLFIILWWGSRRLQQAPGVSYALSPLQLPCACDSHHNGLCSGVWTVCRQLLLSYHSLSDLHTRVTRHVEGSRNAHVWLPTRPRCWNAPINASLQLPNLLEKWFYSLL